MIIFDMDGTLYDLDDVALMNYEIQIAYLQKKTNQTRRQIERYFFEHGIFPKRNECSKSATELFIRDGYSKEEWNIFREEKFRVDDIRIEKCVVAETLLFAKEQALCFLVTSNSYNNVIRILNHLKIPSDVFNEIICSDRNSCYVDNFQKGAIFSYLCEKYGEKPQDLFSIGDRFQTDVRPALEIGGRGAVLAAPCYMPTLLSDFCANQLSTGMYYTYYC